jgi:hypothetical protein
MAGHVPDFPKEVRVDVDECSWARPVRNRLEPEFVRSRRCDPDLIIIADPFRIPASGRGSRPSHRHIGLTPRAL